MIVLMYTQNHDDTEKEDDNKKKERKDCTNSNYKNPQAIRPQDTSETIIIRVNSPTQAQAILTDDGKCITKGVDGVKDILTVKGGEVSKCQGDSRVPYDW